MKRYILILIGMICLAITACTDEIWLEKGTVGNEEGWMTLQFGHKNFEDITVQSRYTLNEVQESYVRNLFVYVFSADGERIYSHFFDSENLKASANEVTSANENCWWVQNRTTTNQMDTYGTIKIKAPAVSNGKLYLVANINDETLRLSAEKLNTVRTLNELKSVDAYLAAEVTSRTPSFPMVAEHTVNITNTNNVFTIALASDEDNDGRADLVRLDAKVKVNVKISNTGNTDTKVQAFIPASWKVVNLPRKSYLLQQDTDYEYDPVEDGYFEAESHFETTTTNDSGETDTDDSFSFYMLENRESPKQSATTYHARDYRIKNPNYGTYDTTKGMWEYAPEWGTYLEIKGELQMMVNAQSTTPQLLTADVVYWVHLGDFRNNNFNDYSVKRNTHYTYNITLKGVENIEVEVSTSNPQAPSAVEENQPGAMGDVYAATEELYTFDAHYGQRVYCLTASQIDTDQMTWYVKTPFGREGTPKVETGTDIPDDLDYQWVKFLVNKTNETGTAYSLNNRTYPGNENQYFIRENSSERLMDVIGLLKFVKEEKEKYNRGEASAFLDGKIYITAFVDEFYYEKHPITGAESPTLWKQFVNQPNRLMHILCDNKKSLDGSSSSTGSIITIRQRSIQTPYNVSNANLTDAWGCETVDEFRDSGFFFYEPDESLTNGPTINNMGNSSRSNGLYNTYKLLGENIDNYGGKVWSRFVNYERPNDYPTDSDEKSYFLQDNAKTLLHSVMMRNRDNDGDGYIDVDELRWYVASIEQLYGIYLGELGMDADAKMYRREKAEATGTYADGAFAGKDAWREHIVSSTRFSSDRYAPIILWAEEGVSVSWYRREIDEGWSSVGTYSIRCARNLGLGNSPTSNNITSIDANVPLGTNELVQVTKPSSVTTSSVYEFDLTNMNEASLRKIYYDGELPPSDEYSKLSAPYYKGFITGERMAYTNGYDNLKVNLDNGVFTHDYAGYRVPNIRELALMYVYCDNVNWWGGSGGNTNNYLSASYYSLGNYGNGNVSGTTTWYIGYNFASLGASGHYIRLVKDRE